MINIYRCFIVLIITIISVVISASGFDKDCENHIPKSYNISDELSDTMSVPLSIPLVNLSNDSVILIAATEIYPYLEKLYPYSQKVVMVGREDDGSAYYFRMVTPAEYGALKIDETGHVSDIVGFVVLDNLFILLNNSFSDVVDNYGERFDFMLCVEKEPSNLYNYDPWERIYVIKDNLVYKLGNGTLSSETAKKNVEYDKHLLNTMSCHRLPDIPEEKVYHISGQ